MEILTTNGNSVDINHNRKSTTGLQQMSQSKCVKVNLSRTLHSYDKYLVNEGEDILTKLDNFRNLKIDSQYTIQNWLNNQSSNVNEGIAKNLGKNSRELNILIETMKHRSPNNWTYSSPIPYSTFESKHNQSDDMYAVNFIQFSYRDRLKIALMSPSQFLKMTSKEQPSKYEISKYILMIKNGTPISTPFLEIDETNSKVMLYGGRHSVMSAKMMNLPLIPVYILTQKPLIDMSRLEKMKLETANFKKVGTT